MLYNYVTHLAGTLRHPTPKINSWTLIFATFIFQICNPSKGSWMAHLKISNPSKGGVSAACQKEQWVFLPVLSVWGLRHSDFRIWFAFWPLSTLDLQTPRHSACLKCQVSTLGKVWYIKKHWQFNRSVNGFQGFAPPGKARTKHPDVRQLWTQDHPPCRHWDAQTHRKKRAQARQARIIVHRQIFDLCNSRSLSLSLSFSLCLAFLLQSGLTFLTNSLRSGLEGYIVVRHKEKEASLRQI